MIDHTPYRDLLAMRDDLTPEEERSLQAHLQSCAECSALGTEYARQDAFLQALRLPLPPQTLQAGVLGRAHHSRARHTWSLWQRGLGLLSAAAVIVMLVLAAVKGSSETSISVVRAPTQAAGRLSQSLGESTPVYGPLQPARDTERYAPETVLPNVTPQPGAVNRSATDASFNHAGVPDTLPRRRAKALGAVQAANAASVGKGGHTVTSVSHGLALSLTIPRSTWKVNAVAPVRLTVRNVSNGYMAITGGTNDVRICPSGKPGVQVLDSEGHVVFPPPSSSGPVPRCPARLMSILPPGKVMTVETRVPLKAHALRAVAGVQIYRDCDPTKQQGCNSQDAAAMGEPLIVRLTR